MPSALAEVRPDDFIETYVPRVDKGRALELGCGRGEQSVTLATLGYEVDAVDIDPRGLISLRSLANEKSLPITTHERRIEEYLRSIPRESFDVILAFNSLHCRDSQENILFFSQFHQIVRALKPGGRFICSLTKYTADREVKPRTFSINSPAHITRENLLALWKGHLDPIHYIPERRLRIKNHRLTNFLCQWDLVAKKPVRDQAATHSSDTLNSRER